MHLNPEKKIAGVLAPVFALRSANDLGVGDVASLRALVDWAVKTGFGLVQILPINETGGDNSPYNAISSVALDVTTLETTPEAVPDLTRSACQTVLQEFDLAELREGAVNYADVKRLKHTLLSKAFTRFVSQEEKVQSERALEFASFCEQHAAWLNSYAIFRVLMDRNGSERWNSWPIEHASPVEAREWLGRLPARAQKETNQRIRYYKYVQWLAFSQWGKLHAYCEERGIALMGDVPFGVSFFSADVWAERSAFLLEWSGGAPPEPYFKDDPFTLKWGQNWGIPLYNWDAMRGDNFRWWRQRVRMVRALLDLFRIDHVLGCYRIFAFPWRPVDNPTFLPLSEQEAAGRTGGRLPGFMPRNDNTWENQQENCAEGEALLRVLLEETGEYRLIAEDLGSVPDYVRPNLRSLKIAGFKIPPWEREKNGELIAGEHYERLSVATYATHDHEPIRSLWESWKKHTDAAGPDGDEARTEMHRMMRFCGLDIENGFPEFSPEIHQALLSTIFRTNSWQAICMVTDLFGLTTRFNVPGAVSASNWSNRMEIPVEKWTADPVFGPQTTKISAILRETGRHE